MSSVLRCRYRSLAECAPQRPRRTRAAAAAARPPGRRASRVSRSGLLPGAGPGRGSSGRGAQLQLGVEPGGARPGHQREQLRPELSLAAVARPLRRGAARLAGRLASSAGTPARSARRCNWAASASAGWPNGTPSSADTAPAAGRGAFRALIASQLRLTSSAPDTLHVAEHVRVPADQLVHDAGGHVVDGEPGAVGALRGDPGVEHDLQQDVAEFVAQRGRVAGLQRLQRLVALLQQVRGERLVGLLGVPRADTRSVSMTSPAAAARAPATGARPAAGSAGRSGPPASARRRAARGWASSDGADVGRRRQLRAAGMTEYWP